jgi:hypothetical protein
MRRLLPLLVFLVFLVGALTTPAQAQSACPSGYAVVPGTESSSIPLCADSEGVIYRADEIEAETREANIAEREANEVGAAALLFYYSMGRGPDGLPSADPSCMSCDFIFVFQDILTDVSQNLFAMWLIFFATLAPLILTIWILGKSMGHMFNGGQDRADFWKGIFKKMALFVLAWLVLVGSLQTSAIQNGNVPDNQYAWHIAGPGLLEASFSLANDSRDIATAAVGASGAPLADSTPFLCEGIGSGATAITDDEVLERAFSVVAETGCIIERMHAMLIATSLATIISSWTQLDFTGAGLGTAFTKFAFGVALLVMAFGSFIYLLFLLLDVVVKALIVAAFLPLIVLMLLFQPTRPHAQTALTYLIAAPAVAFSLGIVAVMAFFLITQSVRVYNATFGSFSVVVRRELQPIEGGDIVQQFGEFLRRVQMDTSMQEAIPMYIAAPWFMYFFFVSIAVFTLGKMIVSTIGQVLEVEGLMAGATAAQVLMGKAGGTAKKAGLGLAAGTAAAAKYARRGKVNKAKTRNPFGEGKGEAQAQANRAAPAR